jgi:uncharacterized protein (TIGR03086 family)
MIDPLGMLERAIGYTRSSLLLVSSVALTNATPCQDWDLRGLLHHMDDSLVALTEAADLGYVGLAPCRESIGADDLVAMIRTRACTLLGVWSSAAATAVSVAGVPLPSRLLVSTGALEIAVHGWDVAQACGHGRPLPPELAEDLERLAHGLVGEADRPARFARPVDVPRSTPASGRLLGFLGRDPHGR